MNAAQGAAKAYVHQAVMTASKEKLVVLLYDACLRNLDRALSLLQEDGSVARVGEALGKAFSIVGELKAALDLEQGGEIGENLDQLYAFVQRRITAANREKVSGPVQEARRVMSDLKEGFDGILRTA